MGERSYKPLELKDLQHLRDVVEKERFKFFKRKPKYTPFKELHLATCLCQGAANHYVGVKKGKKTKGIKDFDVWFFYAEHPKLTYPYRARKITDSGLKKFGRRTRDKERKYVGRVIDMLGREIDDDICRKNNNNPVKCVRGYLTRARTRSARSLSEKAVVGLYPDNILGKIIWPVK
jgi:hypothetical protein